MFPSPFAILPFSSLIIFNSDSRASCSFKRLPEQFPFGLEIFTEPSIHLFFQLIFHSLDHNFNLSLQLSIRTLSSFFLLDLIRSYNLLAGSDSSNVKHASDDIFLWWYIYGHICTRKNIYQEIHLTKYPQMNNKILCNRRCMNLGTERVGAMIYLSCSNALDDRRDAIRYYSSALMRS